MINYSFLMSGSSWSNIDDLSFNFRSSTGFYMFLLPGFSDLFDDNESGFAFSSESNNSKYDQKDVTRFLLLDSTTLSGLSGLDTVNSTLINSFSYRVSFADVINANFSEDSLGEIQLNNHQGNTDSNPNNISYGWYPGLFSSNGNILINSENPISQAEAHLAPGKGGFWLILHELGHSIGGLDHSVGSGYDSQKYTMMSYEQSPDMHASVYPSGLQLLDIIALQDTYGTRNYSTRSGNTEYSLGQGLGFSNATSNTPFMYTIWDGGGVDEIDASGFANGVQIDLRQGHFSSIGKSVTGGSAVVFDDLENDYDAGNVAIAYYTTIENAIGTDEDDILIGNAWNNTLYGGEGNDHLHGDGSSYDDNEEFIGWEESSGHAKYAADYSGDDYLYGEDDDDFLYASRGEDYLDGGDGDDTLVVKSTSLLFSKGEGVQVGGLVPLDGLSVSVDIEYYKVEADTAGHFVIFELGHVYDIEGGLTYENTTLNYSYYDGPLIIDTQNGSVTDSSMNIDTFTLGSGIGLTIIGSHYGDEYYIQSGLTNNFSTASVFTGSGNDIIKSVTSSMSLTDFYFGGGDDIVEEGASAIFRMPVGIEADDLTYTLENITWLSTDPISGNEYYKADLKLTIDGALGGSILYQGAFRATYHPGGTISPAHKFEVTQGWEHVFLQESSSFTAYYPDFEDIYYTSVPTSVGAHATVTSYMSLPYLGSQYNDEIDLDSYKASQAYSTLVYYGLNGNDTIVATSSDKDSRIFAGAGIDTIVFKKSFFSYLINLDQSDIPYDPYYHPTHNYVGVIDPGISGVEAHVYDAEILEFSDASISTDIFKYGAILGTISVDTLIGSSSSDFIMSFAGADTLNGNAGNDFLIAGDDADTLNGGDGNDYLAGGNGDDDLYGDDGNDILVGGAGQDWLWGGDGADTFVLSDTPGVYDVIFDFDPYEGDTVDISDIWAAHFDPSKGPVESFLNLSMSSPNTGIFFDRDGAGGTYSWDLILGLDNFLAPNLPVYFINQGIIKVANSHFGTSSADTGLTGSENNDIMFSREGNDTVYGEDGNDAIYAGYGDDTLYGGDGDDVLYGEEDNDILYGGLGADVLYGFTGSDTFVFESASAYTDIDIIGDFNLGQNDKLDLSDLLAAYDPMTDLITDFIEITTSGSNSILKVDADGGANSFVQIATLLGVTGLTDEAALESSGNIIV